MELFCLANVFDAMSAAQKETATILKIIYEA